MAYQPQTTPGGNLYLGGGGTFPQLQAGLKAIAENRDQIDDGIRFDAKAESDAVRIYADDLDTANRAAWADADTTAKNEAIAAAATDATTKADAARAGAVTDIGNAGGLLYRGQPATGTDLNTLRNPEHAGVWRLRSTGNYLNAPFAAEGHLMVTVGGTSVRQVAVRQIGGMETWTRLSSGSTTWYPWNGVEVQQPAAGINLNDLRKNSDVIIRNSTDAAAVTGGWPDDLGIPRVGAYISVRASTTGLIYQSMQTYGSDPRFLVRSTASTSPSPYPFSAWKDVTAPPTPDEVAPIGQHAGIANSVLLQDFTRRRPVVDTGGLPAVALRFDHGLANFRDLVLPELRRLGLPSALCLNAGDWSRTENGGVTYAEVDGWVVNDQVEIWNHALNHVDVTDPAEFQTQIVTGLTELRSQLPSAVIDGFMPPGSGPYIDFNGGDTVEKWWNTDAGRLILQHHAVATGYISGTAYRVLDGQPRQGQGHWTCDAQTSQWVIDKVNATYSPVRGVQLMLHPSRLNTTGYMTAADWTAALEHIATERDAGRLVVLGAYDLLRARA